MADRKRGCRRADGLCKLTEEQKTARDAQMRSWLNQRRIERVAMAGALLPLPNLRNRVTRLFGVPVDLGRVVRVATGSVTVIEAGNGPQE